MFKRIKDLFSTKPSEKDRKYKIVYFERKGTYAVQCNIKDELWYNKYLCSDNIYWGIKVSFDVLKNEFSSKNKAIKFLQSYLEQKEPIIFEQYIEEFTL